MSFVDQYNALPDMAAGKAIKQNYLQTPKRKPQPKKSPGGLSGFIVNNLPAIGGGLGAVAGIPLDVFGGAGSIAGGAAGAGLGEVLKRKITGQKEDLGQIGIQALEGGAGAAIQPLKFLKGAKTAGKSLQSFVKPGAEVTESGASQATKGSFMKDLLTHGEQAQARPAGLSAGSKVAGKELTPQDSSAMLEVLKREGINTGNGNTLLRGVVDKQKQYGKQIADHFKTNNNPLTKEDTSVIADNFVKSLNTSDPRIIKEAEILSQDLQKNVKSTKDMWDFRKSLDSRIPDTKFSDAATSNKVASIKSMRQYIAKELGNVPGMSNYKDLAEIKPFVSAEAKRLNNPGGGIAGRILSSGPIQKVEDLAGKGIQKVAGGSREIPDVALQEASQAVADLPENIAGKSFMERLVGSPKEGIKNTATFIPRAAAAAAAYPGQSAGQIAKQGIFRGIGNFGQPPQQDQSQTSDQSINMADTLLKSTQGNEDTSNDPFAPENVQANVQAILSQGGKMKDVADYLGTVDAYQKITTPATKQLNATQQQQANNANSGLQDIQNISDMINQDPSIVTKGSIPGSGNGIIQRLTGTTDYAAARNNVIDVISRLRSGKAISASEEKLYKSLLPQAGDTSDSAANKLQRLAVLFEGFSNPAGSSGSDITDLLANAGS